MASSPPTHKNNGDWKCTLRSSDINPDFFVYRSKDLNERLPWDFIDHGIKKSYLRKEYHLALESIESPSCNVGNNQTGKPPALPGDSKRFDRVMR